ncbi:hypothetical protein TUM4261_11870 [Shewanella sp. c952]|uniref:Ig-like domain-containing protein n=1 Tax=Shewanella sp. c952 TaxID=2815913 RepID=UPI001BB87B3D|nr:Ig-like domain-containing protein [Shewanella sp. c952]GIU07193.1 hypothetical protein TUM4261_11870 [Shewanella sp. c952]
MNAQIPCKKLLLASMITMLVACGSDNDDTTPPVDNTPPVAVDDAANVMATKTITIDVLANDTDADGDALSIVSVDSSSAKINNGKVDFTAGNEAGVVTFNYTISDGTAEATAKVIVTVTADDSGNTPPVVEISSRTTDANQVLNINPMLHVTDVDEADVLSIVSVSADNGKATMLADNRIQYDPEDHVGDAVLSYVVSDGTDEVNGTINITANEKIFVGSATCLMCHSRDAAGHQEHGHNFKISKIANDEAPTFPYSSVDKALGYLQASTEGTDNSLGKPNSYADVSYTSGGFGWKFRWLDKDGYIVTGAEAQFNIHAEELGLDDQIMANYNGGTVDKPYNCGNCHTTGWKPTSEEFHPQKQDDLPGVHGTFIAAGVQCESCHGAGAAHALSRSKDDIVRKATPRLTADLQSETMGYGEAMHCAECHTRDGDRNVRNGYVTKFNEAFPEGPEYGARIAVRSGMPRHHQGHDEFMAIDPDSGEIMGKKYLAGMTCSSCHEPHKSALHQDEAVHDGAIKACSTCHISDDANSIMKKREFKDGAISLHAGYECKACHMPDVVKNATTMTNDKGNKVGDIRIHTFRIDLFNDKGQLQDSEAKDTFMNPYLQEGFACGECHTMDQKKAESVLKNYDGKMHK